MRLGGKTLKIKGGKIMRKMKKVLSLALATALCVSMAGCSSKPAETPAPESTTTAAAADTSEEAKTEAAADEVGGQAVLGRQ